MASQVGCCFEAQLRRATINGNKKDARPSSTRPWPASPRGHPRATKMMRNGNQFRCGERLRDGSVCDEAFTRAGNLQRHLRVQHQAEMPARFRFIHMVPDGNGGLAELQEEAHGADDQPEAAVEQPSWRAAMDQMSRDAESIAMHTSSIVNAVANNSGGSNSGAAQQAGRGELPRPRPRAGSVSPRQARDAAFRFGRGVYLAPMPSYVVKRSRPAPSQQCALSWLSQKTKQKVDRTVSRLMRSWGAAPDYTTSCILVPAKWKSRNPAQVLSQLNLEDFTAINSTRLELKADDHKTSFARAAAWFGDWGPKRGVDLDNFLEAGPFQRMDGSHLCHQKTCINRNHLVYEACHVNLGRIVCSDEAQQTRRNSEKVPWGCSRHNPPCLLQLAALTPSEAVLIQRFVFNHGAADEQPPPPRPRQHRYPTFETRTPVSFAADRNGPDPAPPPLTPRDPAIAPRGRVPRPDLCCPFCLAARRTFNSVTGFWGHIVHKHEDEDDLERAAAVRSSARQWESYWLAMGFTPPPDSPTLSKITQALSPGFSWADVRSWNLRQ